METTRRYGPYTVEISSPDKVLFPESGFTKRDLIDYYERVAEIMLPHVRERIVTMHRFPDGIEGESFYQKRVPAYFPGWIKRVKIKKQRGSLEQLTINNTATLVYLANQACIALHVWPSRVDRLNHPDRMIFDLDPPDEDFGIVRAAAKVLREVLTQIRLAPFLMTTGSKGLHVVVPLDRSADFDEVRDFARQVADFLAAEDPKRITTEQRKQKRRGRLFIDVQRNAYAQHAVAPYSLRAKPGAPVAAPLRWHELDRGGLHPRKYTLRNIFQRLSSKGDPWKSIGRSACSLKEPKRRFISLRK